MSIGCVEMNNLRHYASSRSHRPGIYSIEPHYWLANMLDEQARVKANDGQRAVKPKYENVVELL